MLVSAFSCTITHAAAGTNRLVDTRTYDNLNRLHSIVGTDPAAANAVIKSFTYGYNAANQRTRIDREDGTHWHYGYDTLGHLDIAERRLADATPLAGHQFDYSYDALGNRQTASHGGDPSGGSLQTTSYTPQTSGDRNQYATIGYPGAVITTGRADAAAAVTINGQPAAHRQGEYFSHQDAVDNSTGPASLELEVTATLGDASDTITRSELVVMPASTTRTHDLDGNLTFDGYHDYTWDAENRLLSVQTRAGLAPRGSPEYRVEYTYDYIGRRIHRKATRKLGNEWYRSDERRYVYDGWNIVLELGGQEGALTQPWQSCLWGTDVSGSSQGAGGVGGLLSIHKYNGDRPGSHCVSYDGSGNVTALIDLADGSLSASYEYAPFGRTIDINGPFAANNPYRFSTKAVDRDTGYYDYGYRHYDPVNGRWLSRDPLGEAGGLNLYGFIGNDPINAIDYLGLNNIELIKSNPAKFLWDVNAGAFTSTARINGVGSGLGGGFTGLLDTVGMIGANSLYYSSSGLIAGAFGYDLNDTFMGGHIMTPEEVCNAINGLNQLVAIAEQEGGMALIKQMHPDLYLIVACDPSTYGFQHSLGRMQGGLLFEAIIAVGTAGSGTLVKAGATLTGKSVKLLDNLPGRRRLSSFESDAISDELAAQIYGRGPAPNGAGRIDDDSFFENYPDFDNPDVHQGLVPDNSWTGDSREMRFLNRARDRWGANNVVTQQALRDSSGNVVRHNGSHRVLDFIIFDQNGNPKYIVETTSPTNLANGRKQGQAATESAIMGQGGTFI